MVEWDVPKPNFTDIRRRMSRENTLDPRLKRIFGLEHCNDSSGSPSQHPSDEHSANPPMNSDPRTAAVAVDPRRRKEVATIQSPGGPPPSAGLDIQIVLQKSAWYTDLSSKNKIFVNQQLAVLTNELKHYHEDVSAGGPRGFDVGNVYEQSPMLMNVLQQLGIVVDGQGAIQPAAGAPSMNDTNMMMPELAVMIQQQQQQQHQQQQHMMFNMNMNPGMMHSMQQAPGIAPGLLGMAPNLGFPGGGGEMVGNYMMNNMGGGGGVPMGQPPPQGPGFFPQQPPPIGRGNNGNNRGGNFRNNNMGGRNDRWVHNNNNNMRGGNDGRRHNSRRD